MYFNMVTNFKVLSRRSLGTTSTTFYVSPNRTILFNRREKGKYLTLWYMYDKIPNINKNLKKNPKWQNRIAKKIFD